jgi:hypothetical protein
MAQSEVNLSRAFPEFAFIRVHSRLKNPAKCCLSCLPQAVAPLLFRRLRPCAWANMNNTHRILRLLPLFAIGVGLSLLAGCAPKSGVSSYYDNFSGRTDFISDNMLEAPGQPREIIWLNAARIFKQANVPSYYVDASYMSMAEAGLLDIAPGQSLTITTESDTMKFVSASGSVNNRKKMNKGSIVRETAIYSVTKEQLQKIAGAKSVKVQLRGNRGVVEREFGPENFERFRTFVAKYAI